MPSVPVEVQTSESSVTDQACEHSDPDEASVPDQVSEPSVHILCPEEVPLPLSRVSSAAESDMCGDETLSCTSIDTIDKSALMD